MKGRIGEKIKILSYNELLGVSDDQASVEIEIERIKPFRNHPFKILENDSLKELEESVKQNGVLTPVLVRPINDTEYEMISGHRRMTVAERCKMRTIPAIIREMTDEEAVIAMVDSNIQREELLPSERAFAYKMRMEAINRQGKRNDLTLGQNVPKWSHEEIGAEVGLSGRQVKRYIRLTYLIRDLLDLVDEKKIPFTLAVDISYLDSKMQEWLLLYVTDHATVTSTQISALRKEIENRDITYVQMVGILQEAIMPKSNAKKITIRTRDIRRYFPENYTAEKMEETIMRLLEKWSREKEGE